MDKQTPTLWGIHAGRTGDADKLYVLDSLYKTV